MARRSSRFSSICPAISIARRSLMPFTSARRSGSSSSMRSVSFLNFLTMRFASASPTPLTAPEDR